MAIYSAESSRLYLQKLDIEEHLQSYHELIKEPRAMMWSMRSPTTSLSESLQNMREYTPTLEKPWNQHWAIMLKDKDLDSRSASRPRLIGIVGIPREAEMGYRIHPDHWGKGYMSEALTLFVEMWWGLEASQKYSQLLAAADPGNLASTRILIKNGFKKGEYKKDFYTRASLGGHVKSDLQFFYLDRPSKSENI
ncbi:unnamed protein product [Diplocarpon coronariae]